MEHDAGCESGYVLGWVDGYLDLSQGEILRIMEGSNGAICGCLARRWWGEAEGEIQWFFNAYREALTGRGLYGADLDDRMKWIQNEANVSALQKRFNLGRERGDNRGKGRGRGREKKREKKGREKINVIPVDFRNRVRLDR